jgi:glycosyltransferase involved in cell wall biosynthesis
MRILMLTQSYAPVAGGEERAIEDLSLELVARGHDVAVATLPQPGVPGQGPAGVPVETLRSSAHRLRPFGGDAERRHAPPTADPETVLDLRRVLRRRRPDVVHAHNWLVHSYLPLQRRCPAALVLSLHDYGTLCATKRLFRRGAPCSGPTLGKCVRCAGAHYGKGVGGATAVAVRLSRTRLGKRVDLFLPVSEAVAEGCRLGADDAFHVVPNFVREREGGAVTEDPRLGQLPSTPFLLFFGDATEDKGAEVLAEAYARLDRPPPLVFLGRCRVEGLARRAGITVLGPWPHSLAMEALRRSWFVLAPSIWPEPFGLVALEAAAAGKPVVASAIGGLRDTVLDGETGLLVRPGDRAGLAAAAARLIDDSALRERMGRAARLRAARFRADVVVPAVERAYGEAIERRGGGSV